MADEKPAFPYAIAIVIYLINLVSHLRMPANAVRQQQNIAEGEIGKKSWDEG